MVFPCDFNGNTLLFGMLLFCSCFQIGNCETICPTEQFHVMDSNRTLTVTWLETISDKARIHISFRHRCLDKYKHYVTRTCEESGWVPSANNIFCSYVIDEYIIKLQCPPYYNTFPGYLDDIRICYRIMSKQPWDNTCLSSGSSLTLSELNLADRLLVHRQFIINFLDNVPPIWLPAKQMWLKKAVHSLSNMNLRHLNDTVPPIWLPAKQMWLKKSIHPLSSTDVKHVNSHAIENSIQWALAGIHGVQVKLSNIELEHLDGCLLTKWEPPNRIRRVVTDCNSKNSMVCLYNQREPTMLQLSCPQGYKSTRYAQFQNRCIKIQRFSLPLSRHLLTDDFVKQNICENVFTVNSGSTLHIFQELARNEKLTHSDRCLFRVIPDTVIISVNDWLQLDMRKIEFVNWSLNVSIHMNTTNPLELHNHILMTKSNGEWVWEANKATCAICFIQNEILMPTIELYKYEKNSLMVRLEMEQFLWRDHRNSNGFSCFAFVYTTKEIKIVKPSYQKDEGKSKLFKISTKDGEGKYWCSGLQIGSFRVIETEIVHIERLIKFAIHVRRPSSMSPFHWIVNRFREFLTSYIDPQHLYIDNVTLNLTTPQVLLFHVVVLIQSDDYLTFEENRLNISDTMLSVYYVATKLNEIRLATSDSPIFNILSLNSTLFCLPTSISKLDKINWGGARLGQYITSVEFCLLPTGLPITKRCVGDSLFGGAWIPLPRKFDCKNNLQSNVTYNLHTLINSYLTSENTSQALYQMNDIVFDSHYSCLIAADVFYVSQILKDVSNYMPTYPLDSNDLLDVLLLYDRLLMVNETITRSAASLNATNVLLNILDTILTTVVTSDYSDTITYDSSISEAGVTSILQPRLSSFMFHPHLTEITGIAILNTSNTTIHEWTEYEVQYLYQNQSVTDVLATPNLIIASYIPKSLLLKLDDADLHIIMTLFINDILFQTNIPDFVHYSSNRFINSSGSIISIIVTNSEGNLPDKLPIFITPDHRNKFDIENVCGYWNFTNLIDGWSWNGCVVGKSSITSSTVLCECNHLTHFAYLFHGHSSIDENHIRKLNMITLIGCALSLAGVLGIYLTAISFPSWRKLCSTKFLLQFSAAIAFEMIMVLFINTEANSLGLILADQIFGCIALGALLHYSVLVTFFWMFIIAYMQFMRYVIVFHKLKTSHFFFKASLFGWGIPILPVLLVLLTDPMSYVPNLEVSAFKICYPSGYSLYFAVMTPIALITSANLIIFLLVINSLTNNLTTGTDSVRTNRDKSSLLSQLRLSIFLFFLLGLTWIFAFLSTSSTGLVFTYLFCITATLQGFILFFYFILLDPVARNLWIGLFKKICCK